MKKKIFTVFLLLAASIGTTSAESGTCGDNLTWDLTDGVLTISGTGAMDNYYYQSDYVDSNNDIRAPWFGYKIDTIIINEGVTKIGDYAFFRFNRMITINFLSNQPCELGVNVVTNGKIVVDCEALDAYHTAWDNYLVRYYGYNVGWREYHPFGIYGPKSPYTITNSYPSGGWIELTPHYLTACDETIQAEASPEIGYYFSKWEDGQTENPRTFGVNSDITIPSAIFEPYTEGICGQNLTWKYNNHTLTIQGTGEMWCDSVFEVLRPEYKEEAISWAGVANDITDVIISEGVTNIGSGVFSICSNLKNIYIASTVKRIGYYSFEDCYNIETITCYGAQPPAVILDDQYGQDDNSFPTDMPKSTIIYVPADYLDTYKSHDLWGLYDVRPLEAKSTETNNLNVTPAENMVEVAWPAVSGATTYELVIKDKSGNVICTLIFNANGQLTQIAFHAPTRNNTPQQTQAAGFSFTITSLESGTSYDLTITSKDNNGGTLDTKTVSFTTTGVSTRIGNVLSNRVPCTKVIRDGQIFVLRGDKTYTIQGQEVK